MKEEIISITFEDLLEALSHATGTDISEMDFSLDFLPNFIYGIHEKDDILHKNIPEKLVLSIAYKKMALYYTFISDLNELQADGISLYDHAVVMKKHFLKDKDVDWDRTYIILPKESQKNIICKFDLKDFTDSKFYDENIKEAIIGGSAKQKTLKKKF